MRRMIAAAVLGFVVFSFAEPVTAAQLTLTWQDNSNNEDGFSVERKLGLGGAFGVVGSVVSNITTFVNSWLADGVEYCYRVVAFNQAGAASSTEVCKTTPAAPTPPAPPTAPVGLTVQ